MRIALISDIHYGKYSTTSELASPGEPLQCVDINNGYPLYQGMINILTSEQPNYLFVAGDITSTGNPLEFRDSYEKIINISKEANIPFDNVILCLGNHDIDWRITKIVDEYKKSTDHAYLAEDISYIECSYFKLATDWAINDNSKLPINARQYTHQFNNAPLAGVVERDDCIIFILNSGHLCTHEESKKHGSLSEPQLQWFENLVRTYTSSTKTKIVLLHHHPFSYPFPHPKKDDSILEEGSELYQICGEYGIDLVLHGHRHHPKAKTVTEGGWINPVTYICAGSLSVNSTHRRQGDICIPNTFHIIEYSNRERIVLRNFEYTFAEGWIMTKDFRSEFPLEGSMLLGKPVNVSDHAIKELVKGLQVNKKIIYEDLDNDLLYLFRHKLIDLVEQTFTDCIVYPKPDHFMIYKPQGDA